jgi:hypothetical protein
MQASKLTPLGFGLAGMICGLVSAVCAFLPHMLIQMWFLGELERYVGRVYDLPFPLLVLLFGVPLPYFLFPVIPVGGAFLGLVGAGLGAGWAHYKGWPVRYQWLAALVSGALAGAAINLPVSFWAQ